MCHRLKPVLAACAALAIVGCGGGGSNSSAPHLTVSADRNRLDFAAFAGQTLPVESLILTATGGSGSLYAGWRTTLPGVFSADLQITGSNSAAVTFYPAPTFVTVPRVASGTITLLLSSDIQGANILWSKDFPVALSVFGLVSPSVSLNTSETLTAPVSGPLLLTPADSSNVVTATAPGNAWLSALHTAPDTLTVTANPAGMALGSYQGTLQLKAVDATLSVPVDLTIGNAIGLQTRTINLDAQTLPAALQGTLGLTFAGGLAPAWAAASDKEWLVLGASAGTGPSPLSYSIDLSRIGTIPDWSSDTATVTVQAPGLTAQTTRVVLNKNLPQVLGVVPGAIKAGQAGQVTLIGKGFNQLSGGSGFSIPGAGAVTATITSDTQAVLQVGALSAATYQVSVPLASGAPSASANLAAVVPAGYPYAAVPTTGTIRSAKYDPSRRAVFAVNIDSSALERIKWNGSAWGTSMVPIATIGDFGLSLDGQRLFVTSNAGGTTTLYELDPDTLQTRATYPLSVDLLAVTKDGYTFTDGLQATRDGRLWINGDGWSYPCWFDLDQAALAWGPCGIPGNNDLLDSPHYHASGDTTRLLMEVSNPTAMFPDYLYLPATGSVTSASNIPFGNWYAFNFDGTRLLVDNGQLYDGTSFAWLGSASDPATWYNWGVLSDDGSRIYRAVSTIGSNDTFTRLDVFDTTQLTPGTTRFLKIGSIPLTDQPCVCNSMVYPRMILNELEGTLYLLGNQNLVVVPIPANLAPQAASPRIISLKRIAE